MDHFAVLGLPRSFALDLPALERSYLQKSRELHPDHQRHLGEERQAELLRRSAELNNAYKALKDPFDRAEHLVEILDPEAMARAKNLPRDFLLDAMELAERVADCAGGEAQALAAEILEQIDEFLRRLAQTFAHGQDRRTAAEAADLLHRSKYWRKALQDLTETMDE